MTTTESAAEVREQKVSLPTLTAMVVGSMVGAGVFLLRSARQDSTKRTERSSTTANRRERNHLPHN